MTATPGVGSTQINPHLFVQINPHLFGWSFEFGGFRLQKLMQTTKVHGRELRGAKIPPK